MTTTVKTINSTYEIDGPNKKIRRLEGDNEPTPRQGEDGVWKQYSEIKLIQAPPCLVIVWDRSIKDGAPILHSTVTSDIVNISGDALNL